MITGIGISASLMPRTTTRLRIALLATRPKPTDANVRNPPAVPRFTCQAKDMTIATAREQFRTLHQSGSFIIPNPHDVGSACLFEAMGFSAIATTSAGFAWSLGRPDMGVTRDELVAHVRAITSVVQIPLNVDAERCFADDPAGVGDTINMLADAGASGISIEDWNPATNAIDSVDIAVARVAAAAEAAHQHGITLTARCENHLHGVTDFDDTMNRMRAYNDAGADVLFAPGIATNEQIEAMVSIGAPVNVILAVTKLSTNELGELGVRRISIGGALAAFGYGAMVTAAQQLLDNGRFESTNIRTPADLMQKAFRVRSRD
jgi:2-methylisocitrate lyase-like PEP mutase family enzyme